MERIAFNTSRKSTSIGRPAFDARGSKGSIRAHSSSVKSLGYRLVFFSILAIRPRVAGVHIPSLNHGRKPHSTTFQTDSNGPPRSYHLVDGLPHSVVYLRSIDLAYSGQRIVQVDIGSHHSEISFLMFQGAAFGASLGTHGRNMPWLLTEGVHFLTSSARNQILCSARSICPARSPMMIQAAMVFPVITRGMIEPSAMRRLSIP